MNPNNNYTNMQKKFYEKLPDPSYHNAKHLNEFEGSKKLIEGLECKEKIALDVGCGLGRSIVLYKDKFLRIDGCDLCKVYLNKASDVCRENNLFTKLYETDGVSLSSVPSETYDVVFSITVLQHIPVYDIRFNLLKEMYRVLKPGGTLSVQMGFGSRDGAKDYYENYYDAPTTNSGCDVKIMDTDCISKDLESIGFKNFTFQLVEGVDKVGDAYDYWIIFRGTK